MPEPGQVRHLIHAVRPRRAPRSPAACCSRPTPWAVACDTPIAVVAWSSLFIPRQRIGALSSCGRSLDASRWTPGSRRYVSSAAISICCSRRTISRTSRAAAAGHIGTTITDLIALAFGAGREASELARACAGCAARALEIVRRIGTGFTRPSFGACGSGACDEACRRATPATN